ncbi:MAG TPA: LLM class flavin-dependent oxidoreductase [Acidimicrobiales bacterium]|jgi:5,10-methylenetetrahydromethanopterin reductase|nr:LLM class flavin-dependent oxidoreductase [Acidimicrobiales bacterium]
MATEFWTTGAGVPTRIGEFARRAEAEGWDGLALVDSQNLAPDPYVALGLAAAATSTLKLATGVTNPLTRHPAAAATVAATVQAASAGRFVMGIGRGDSSLAHLGLAPASPKAFERYLVRLQGYLRGDEVPFEVDMDGADVAAASSHLGMAGGPTGSQIRWIVAAGLPKVPVDVAATGPRVIAIAARHADRVSFAVGASATRLSWAIDQYRQTRADGDLTGVGAYIPVLVHPDRDVAREHISGGVASFARFSVMHGSVTGPADERSRAALEAVHDAYDMNHHFSHGSPQSQGLTADVIDEFGIAGPPDYCIERLQELVRLGLTKFILMAGGIGMDRQIASQSRKLLSEVVFPALR